MTVIPSPEPDELEPPALLELPADPALAPELELPPLTVSPTARPTEATVPENEALNTASARSLWALASCDCADATWAFWESSVLLSAPSSSSVVSWSWSEASVALSAAT